MTNALKKAVSLLLAAVLVTGCCAGLDAATLVSLAAPQAKERTAAQDDKDKAQAELEKAAKEKAEKAARAAEKAVKAKEKTKADKAKSEKAQDGKKSDDRDADDKDAKGDKKKDKEKQAKEKAAKEKAEKAKAAKQRQIVRAVAYLNTLESQLETATEDLSQIRRQRKKAQAQTAEAKKSVASAKYALTHAKRSLNTTVKEIYENGSLSYLSVLFGSKNFDDFASRLYLLETIASKREEEVTKSRGLRDTYQAKLFEYQASLEKVRSLESDARERSKTITDSISSQLDLIGGLDPSVLAAVNDYDSVKASRKWLAKFSGSKSKKGSHPEIVEIAGKYLGVPYVWGGETPSGFDCSGLVMYCYAKIGIQLPHFARSQYDCGKHINASALMPGDLVFFGPNVEGIHHVGIYVGDGRYIQAPRTGDVVKVSSLSDRSDYVGACRPGA